MNNALLIRFFLAIVTLGGFLYFYIAKQNEITELRLQIPALAKELEEINQEITQLKYEINKIEDPARLIELARKPEYRHLKHPLLKEIIQIKVK